MEAMRLAARGLYECRVCGRRGQLADAVATFCRGQIVNAVCLLPCARENEIVIGPHENGVEVRLRARKTLVVASSMPSVPLPLRASLQEVG